MSDEVRFTQVTMRMLRALMDQAKNRRIAAGEDGITDEDVVGDVVTVTTSATIAADIDQGVSYKEKLAALMGKLLEARALDPDEESDRAISSTKEGAEAYIIKPGAIDALRRWESL